MIVVELAGGLGNQCFQYAAARTAADRLGVPLGLDLRLTRTTDGRPFLLGPFAIRAEPVPDRELLGVHARQAFGRRFLLNQGEAIVGRLRGSRFLTARRIIEPSAWYSPILDQVTDHSWLSGYWQSERYFASAAAAIRSDLTPTKMSARTEALGRRIAATECPVAVHVRRGDYAAVASTQAFHGLCEPQYYRAAMAHVRAQQLRATFVFFSDEPGWVAANLAGPDHLVIDGNGDRPHEDLHLMRQCRAHIIANSTFGWWGAWLAGTRLVIAPRSWYRSPAMARHDIVPDRWIRL